MPQRSCRGTPAEEYPGGQSRRTTCDAARSAARKSAAPPVGSFVGPNVAGRGRIEPISPPRRASDSADLQAITRKRDSRRVASHARGRRFETRRAHHPGTALRRGFCVPEPTLRAGPRRYGNAMKTVALRRFAVQRLVDLSWQAMACRPGNRPSGVPLPRLRACLTACRVRLALTARARGGRSARCSFCCSLSV
jgi:hypothetical protein